MHYAWPAVHREIKVLENYATETRGQTAALFFLKRMMKRYGRPMSGTGDLKRCR